MKEATKLFFEKKKKKRFSKKRFCFSLFGVINFGVPKMFSRPKKLFWDFHFFFFSFFLDLLVQL